MAKVSPSLSRLSRVASRPKFPGGFFYGVAALCLSGCASGGSALVESFQMLAGQAVAGGQVSAASMQYDPKLRYLSAQWNDGPVAVLVLGYVDNSPQGAVEVWYSADAQVLKLRDGRVLATQGLPLDWSRVWFDTPPVSWHSLSAHASDSVRFHDELPSYRFGVAEAVQTQAWYQAVASRWKVPADVRDAKHLQWFKETAREMGATGSPEVSWFAWDAQAGTGAVVYSEQCLAPALCLRLHRLPVPKEKM